MSRTNVLVSADRADTTADERAVLRPAANTGA